MRWIMKRFLTLFLFCVTLAITPAVFCSAQDVQEGNATWYKTDSLNLGASHAKLPLGTRLRVTNLNNYKVVYVTVTNRIPNSPDRVLDISAEAARIIEMTDTDITPVSFEVVSGFSTESLFPEPGMAAILAEAEPESFDETEPDDIPEITAVTAEDEPEDEEPLPPPQPPVRVTVPAGSNDTVKPDVTPVPQAPTVTVTRVDTDSQGIAVKVIINVNGQEHIIDIPNVMETAVPAPAPAAAAPVRSSARAASVVPKMPDPSSKKVYRVQAGAYSTTAFAQECYDRLKDAGFSPAFERYNNLYRVVVSGVKAADMQEVSRRLGAAGFAEVWIREEN